MFLTICSIYKESLLSGARCRKTNEIASENDGGSRNGTPYLNVIEDWFAPTVLDEDRLPVGRELVEGVPQMRGCVKSTLNFTVTRRYRVPANRSMERSGWKKENAMTGAVWCSRRHRWVETFTVWSTRSRCSGPCPCPRHTSGFYRIHYTARARTILREPNLQIPESSFPKSTETTRDPKNRCDKKAA